MLVIGHCAEMPRRLIHRIRSEELVSDFQHLCGVRKHHDNGHDASNGHAHDAAKPKIAHSITNVWLHGFFKAASFFGTEDFYSLFFPLFFWSMDAQTGRKVCMVWALSMYVGQSLKDMIKMGRPRSPPVVHLEQTFIEEYGMPSTHALVACAIPLSLYLFASETCQFHPLTTFVLLGCVPLAVMTSRVYMGVHRVSVCLLCFIIVART